MAKTVLIVDDSATIRQVVGMTLKGAGYEVMEASDGKDALNKLDGKKINLYANIGNPGNLPQVLANDAEGIGLFRSEFLYLESSDYPTEDQQFEAYKQAAEALQGKTVVIRTLDIGADKKIGRAHV